MFLRWWSCMVIKHQSLCAFVSVCTSKFPQPLHTLGTEGLFHNFINLGFNGEFYCPMMVWIPFSMSTILCGRQSRCVSVCVCACACLPACLPVCFQWAPACCIGNKGIRTWPHCAKMLYWENTPLPIAAPKSMLFAGSKVSLKWLFRLHPRKKTTWDACMSCIFRHTVYEQCLLFEGWLEATRGC